MMLGGGAERQSDSAGEARSGEGSAQRVLVRRMGEEVQPAPATADTADNDPLGCGETLFGILVSAVLILVVFLIYSVFSIGRPASYLCLGALVCAGIAYIAAESIKDADAKRKGLTMTIAGGFVGDVMRAALWTAAGLGIVWLFMLLLHFAPGVFGPGAAADLQLGAYDLAAQLKSLVTPLRFGVAVVVAIVMAVVAGTVWPINAAGTAKKWIGTAALLLLTFANVSFVTAKAGSARYDEAVAPMRAKIGEDLERLRSARQEHAALQWLGAELKRQVEESPSDAAAWREYLTLAGKQCRTAEERFEAGYRSYANAVQSEHPTYCRTDDYLPALVERQFKRTPGTAATAPADVSLWLPEFKTAAAGRYPRSTDKLQSLAKQVDKAAAEQERARARVEATVVALVSTMVGETGGGVAGQVLDRLKETVLKALVRDGRERVAMWLQLNNATLPTTLNAILGIEPELKLESPREAMAAAGGADAFVAQAWNRDYRRTGNLEQLGHSTAIKFREYYDWRVGEIARIGGGRPEPRVPVDSKPRAPRGR